MGDAHDIFVCNLFFRGGSKLNRLRRLKINQIVLYDQLGKLVPGVWDHAVCDNASVLCDGNIRCSGSDIHKRDI